MDIFYTWQEEKTTLHRRNLLVQRMILHKMNFLSHFEYVFRHLQIFHRLNKQELGVTHKILLLSEYLKCGE
jgi:hypothetical protein